MKKIVDDLRLIYKCCCLYYLDDMSQQEICNHIGISRATVSRLLKAGRDTGIVNIQVKNPVSLSYGELERKIEKEFGIKEVVVANGSPLDSKEEQMNRINTEALRYLSRLFKDGDYVGVSMGSTLNNVVKDTPDVNEKSECIFVPVVGGISSNQQSDRSIHANEIANSYANKFGGKAIQFFAPALFADITVMKGFMKEKPVQEVLNYYEKLSTVVMGVGIPEIGGSTLVQHGYVEKQQLQKYIDDGVVGDLSLKFFDRNGDTDKFKEFNDRVSGLSLSQLKTISNRVGIASGKQKAEALLGAIRGGMINMLITDLECAEELLKLI